MQSPEAKSTDLMYMNPHSLILSLWYETWLEMHALGPPWHHLSYNSCCSQSCLPPSNTQA